MAQHISLVTEHREITQQRDSLSLGSAEQELEHKALLAAHKQLTRRHDSARAELDAMTEQEAALTAAHEHLQQQQEQLQHSKAAVDGVLSRTEAELSAAANHKVTRTRAPVVMSSSPITCMLEVEGRS